MSLASEDKLPWFKFYPTDWRADPKLRKCSLAARGLWIELCSLMHENTPYGHLCDEEGNPPTNEEISLLVAAPLADVEAALLELGKKGVLSRTPANVIYCRRMERDHRRSTTNRKNAKGNPDWRRKASEAKTDPLDNSPGNSVVIPLKQTPKSLERNGGSLEQVASTQSPEARVQKEEILASQQSVDLTAEAQKPANGSSWNPNPNAKPPPNLPGLERIWAADDPWGDLARDLVFAIESKSKGTILGANTDILFDWKADGIDINLARSVVNEGIKLDGPKGSIKFWNARVRERDAQRKAALARPAVKKRPEAKDLTEDQWISAIKLFRDSGAWAAPGYDPQMSTCDAPPHLLAMFGYGPLARRRQ